MTKIVSNLALCEYVLSKGYALSPGERDRLTKSSVILNLSEYEVCAPGDIVAKTDYVLTVDSTDVRFVSCTAGFGEEIGVDDNPVFRPVMVAARQQRARKGRRTPAANSVLGGETKTARLKRVGKKVGKAYGHAVTVAAVGRAEDELLRSAKALMGDRWPTLLDSPVALAFLRSALPTAGLVLAAMQPDSPYAAVVENGCELLLESSAQQGVQAVAPVIDNALSLFAEVFRRAALPAGKQRAALAGEKEPR